MCNTLGGVGTFVILWGCWDVRNTWGCWDVCNT